MAVRFYSGMTRARTSRALNSPSTSSCQFASGEVCEGVASLNVRRCEGRRVKTSLFEIFKIGIGPSSSHTMGPMRAAAKFAAGLREGGLLEKVTRVEANLY